jgi:hypothetical protein
MDSVHSSLPRTPGQHPGDVALSSGLWGQSPSLIILTSAARRAGGPGQFPKSHRAHCVAFWACQVASFLLKNKEGAFKRKEVGARRQWLLPTILATWEAEIKMITVPRTALAKKKVWETLFQPMTGHGSQCLSSQQ